MDKVQWVQVTKGFVHVLEDAIGIDLSQDFARFYIASITNISPHTVFICKIVVIIDLPVPVVL